MAELSSRIVAQKGPDGVSTIYVMQKYRNGVLIEPKKPSHPRLWSGLKSSRIWSAKSTRSTLSMPGGERTERPSPPSKQSKDAAAAADDDELKMTDKQADLILQKTAERLRAMRLARRAHLEARVEAQRAARKPRAALKTAAANPSSFLRGSGRSALQSVLEPTTQSNSSDEGDDQESLDSDSSPGQAHSTPSSSSSTEHHRKPTFKATARAMAGFRIKTSNSTTTSKHHTRRSQLPIEHRAPKEVALVAPTDVTGIDPRAARAAGMKGAARYRDPMSVAKAIHPPLLSTNDLPWAQGARESRRKWAEKASKAAALGSSENPPPPPKSPRKLNSNTPRDSSASSNDPSSPSNPNPSQLDSGPSKQTDSPPPTSAPAPAHHPAFPAPRKSKMDDAPSKVILPALQLPLLDSDGKVKFGGDGGTSVLAPVREDDGDCNPSTLGGQTAITTGSATRRLTFRGAGAAALVCFRRSSTGHQASVGATHATPFHAKGSKAVMRGEKSTFTDVSGAAVAAATATTAVEQVQIMYQTARMRKGTLAVRRWEDTNPDPPSVSDFFLPKDLEPSSSSTTAASSHTPTPPTPSRSIPALLDNIMEDDEDEPHEIEEHWNASSKSSRPSSSSQPRSRPRLLTQAWKSHEALLALGESDEDDSDDDGHDRHHHFFEATLSPHRTTNSSSTRDASQAPTSTHGSIADPSGAMTTPSTANQPGTGPDGDLPPPLFLDAMISQANVRVKTPSSNNKSSSGAGSKDIIRWTTPKPSLLDRVSEVSVLRYVIGSTVGSAAAHSSIRDRSAASMLSKALTGQAADPAPRPRRASKPQPPGPVLTTPRKRLHHSNSVAWEDTHDPSSTTRGLSTMAPLPEGGAAGGRRVLRSQATSRPARFGGGFGGATPRTRRTLDLETA